MNKTERTLFDMPNMRFRGQQYAELTASCLRQTPIKGHNAVIPLATLRKDVDRYFREQLREAGMNPIRAWWCYWDVRIGYPIWSWWSGNREHDTRRS